MASLIYINQLMQNVLNGTYDFHEFGTHTQVLLLGSKNGSTEVKALNILTVLKECNSRYPELQEIYSGLSESAHPNWDGLCWGYSKVNHDELVTNFSNRWMDLYGERHLDLIDLCMTFFLYEYDGVWPPLFEKLEKWLEENDEKLEATKNAEQSD